MPTSGATERARPWLDRLDAAEARLSALAGARLDGLTDPDPGGDERWEHGQAWAHIAEFGDYWLDEIDRLLASSEPAPAFGRVKSNPARIAAIESGRSLPVEDHLAVTLKAMGRLRALLSSLTAQDWAREATHQTLGVLSMDRILEEFLIGHYEQHAAQLEGLRS